MSSTRYTRRVYDQYGRKYHQKRKVPETSFWNRYLEVPAMTSLLKNIVRNKKVLDLGSGSGIFTKKLHSWGGKVVGLDNSKTMIDIAESENPNIKFFRANAQKTPFQNNQFDIISSSLMAHHFKDLKPLFKEVTRILKKNGVFVFSIHHPFYEILNKEGETFVAVPYFHNKKYTWKMMSKKMISYHHTFENISQSLHRFGLVIEKIREPSPKSTAEKINKKDYFCTSRYPAICVFMCRKK